MPGGGSRGGSGRRRGAAQLPRRARNGRARGRLRRCANAGASPPGRKMITSMRARPLRMLGSWAKLRRKPTDAPRPSRIRMGRAVSSPAPSSGPNHRPGAAHHGVAQDVHRPREAEVAVVQGADAVRVERPRGPGDHGAHEEREALVGHDVDPHGGGGLRVSRSARKARPVRERDSVQKR